MSDKIITRPMTNEYAEGWTRIFGHKDEPIPETERNVGDEPVAVVTTGSGQNIAIKLTGCANDCDSPCPCCGQGAEDDRERLGDGTLVIDSAGAD